MRKNLHPHPYGERMKMDISALLWEGKRGEIRGMPVSLLPRLSHRFAAKLNIEGEKRYLFSIATAGAEIEQEMLPQLLNFWSDFFFIFFCLDVGGFSSL